MKDETERKGGKGIKRKERVKKRQRNDKYVHKCRGWQARGQSSRGGPEIWCSGGARAEEDEDDDEDEHGHEDEDEDEDEDGDEDEHEHEDEHEDQHEDE